MRFEFKSFGLEHGESAMKIGFDSVLLGGWAEVNDHQKVLDIGAGCGILGLMLSQKANQIRLTSVEIDPLAALECERNGAQIPWRINHSVKCADFKEFAGNSLEKFDVMISNPPYFEVNGQISESQREQARQQTDLSLSELFKSSAALSHENSTFYLIFPSEMSKEVGYWGRTHGWWCAKEIEVRNKSHQNPKRTLWKWVRSVVQSEKSTLVVNNERGEKTEEYQKMVAPFLR